MGFYFNRYIQALRRRKNWALLMPFLVITYLAYAAIHDVRFTVSQAFSAYSAALPVAASNSPIGMFKMDELVLHPELFFLDSFALNQLRSKLGFLESHGALGDEAALRSLIRHSMSLSVVNDAHLTLSYVGNNPMLGRILVSFYSDRLLKKVFEGVRRITQGTAKSLDFKLAGDVDVSGRKLLWSEDRLLPALSIFLLSSIAILVLVGIWEMADPSFKSERQVARYLGIPVLGVIPNVEVLASNLLDEPAIADNSMNRGSNGSRHAIR